jgi:hypothetical protein
MDILTFASVCMLICKNIRFNSRSKKCWFVLGFCFLCGRGFFGGCTIHVFGCGVSLFFSLGCFPVSVGMVGAVFWTMPVCWGMLVGLVLGWFCSWREHFLGWNY